MKKLPTRKYLFGPVSSRRLGISLGIDLVPAKVCVFDCIYCESGATTHATLERHEAVPTAEVLREVDDFLGGHPELDVISFSGAGEPTLHSGIGRVLSFIKQRYPMYRVALLTNSALFYLPRVRAELRALDIVIPSLDAADDMTMARINRPVEGVSAEAMIAGLAAFRRESAAEMWLEVFLVPGVNDDAGHLERLRRAVKRIAPDRVQLNTLDRPGPEPGVRAADRGMLESLLSQWRPLPVEIIAAHPPARCSPAGSGVSESDLGEKILEMLRRRPCTAADLEAGLGADGTEVSEILRVLHRRGSLIEERGARGVFYRAVAPSSS